LIYTRHRRAKENLFDLLSAAKRLGLSVVVTDKQGNAAVSRRKGSTRDDFHIPLANVVTDLMLGCYDTSAPPLSLDTKDYDKQSHVSDLLASARRQVTHALFAHRP
jgi:hypothetical protein